MPSWCQGSGQYDCIFMSTDDMKEGMLSMDVAQVLCLFSFVHTNGQTFPCTLIHWFDQITDKPDKLTGMWMVTLSFVEDSSHLTVIHIDSIIHSMHLLPIFWDKYPLYVNCHNLLDIFHGFYVNHFADHHMFKLAS
ncbi:hypothetical protein F5J12DRAFT_724696 [Pisolithus orientalis]|uniref:uncharacterized protein n=1 Tax=Pisolithus orientalis TaxID=936130 RepID=UPI002224FE41|nr:uncharacterized protein F5J12DRAFT_724696 [Pisolithus orientalis]KAI5998922.1 hypothetical protein F5J12DRAFT_724696 [Pisolithus orientalis]